MTLDLYLLRHAETEYNAHNNLIGGQSNFLKLSERGKNQAKILGARFVREGVKFDEIYSSTAERTQQTARIVCGAIGFPIARLITTPKLLELSQGDWEGKELNEIYVPEVLDEMKAKHWNFKAPNGESQKDVEERVYSWVEKTLLQRNENLTVGIFGHGVATKCLLRRIMDSNPELTYRICVNNCSISRLKYSHSGQHQGWSLIKINDDTHLSESGFNPATFV
ncbi:MAG: histidine phosphatase family protein [Nanoarchaeota archaeon]|nr:histidine phosphatase family protein [Nanoarchaeota archaeon]